jgi:putative hydrolase of the HAD superfamily
LTATTVAAVLFDLGGVLLRLDYEAIVAHAAGLEVALRVDALARAEAAARRAVDARTQARGSVPGSDAVRLPSYFDDLLAEAGLGEPRRRVLGARLEAEHRVRNLWRVPLEGAAETLAALRRAGLRTGVVSNADGRAASLLRGAGLADQLEVIVDSHEEGVEKPHPEIFRRALQRLGVRAEESLFVGDIFSIDVLGSRAAGLRAILMDATGGYADAACERIGRLADLLPLLHVAPPPAGEGA